MQRNMAANCGLDYRAAAEFVGCIVARELGAMGQEESCSIRSAGERQASRIFNLGRALPMLDGLYAGLCRTSGSDMAPSADAPEKHGCGHEYSRPDEVGAADLLTCGDAARFLELLGQLVHQARAAVTGADTVTGVS